jgi:hypothetical protein
VKARKSYFLKKEGPPGPLGWPHALLKEAEAFGSSAQKELLSNEPQTMTLEH